MKKKLGDYSRPFKADEKKFVADVYQLDFAETCQGGVELMKNFCCNLYL